MSGPSHQPDIVQCGAGEERATHREIETLEAQLAARQRELEAAARLAGDNRLGTEVMAVLLASLSTRVSTVQRVAGVAGVTHCRVAR